jgi:NodT family efflux transporter outer membrane factor (OMF) lipoprotein
VARADTSRWWLEFEDATLNALVEEALENNFTLHGAVARVDAAAAIARSIGAELYPMASANMNSSRRKQNLIGIPIPGGPSIITTHSTSHGVSLDIMWELDLWGRVRSAKSAALADLQASWADLAAIRLSIAAQTVKAWFALTESKLQVELAEKSLESYRRSADYVRARYQQGVRSSLDLRLALSSFYAAETVLEMRREQLKLASRQLEILLARYPSGSLKAGDDLPPVSTFVPAGLPSDVLLRRPDLLAAERRYAAAESRVSEARRAFFPRITLTASGGTMSDQLKDLVSGDFSVWSIAAGLTQPIFQGGRLIANLSQSHAVSDQLLADYALSLLNAFGEVEASLFREQSLTKQEISLKKATDQSIAAQELAEQQYTEGIVDYITVLETQRRSFTAQIEHLNVRRTRLDARINLHLALGGGFDISKEWMEFLESQNQLETEGTIE